MNEEYEVKFLDIDPITIEKKILAIGGKQEYDRVVKSRTFDYPGFPLNKIGAWVRLRDDGNNGIFLAYKQRLGIKDDNGKTNDKGMEEHEVRVDDFEEANQILLKIGLIEKFIEEKRRVSYKFKDIDFEIDYCPGLKPYLEIESTSWEKVDKAIELLELNPKDKKIFSAFQIYDLAGINMLEYKELSFRGLFKREG